MNEEQKKELLGLQEKADKILINYRDKGNEIEWGLVWMESLTSSILKKDFVTHNKCFLWFKLASYKNKEFDKVFDIVNKMTSYIYIND